ncbi:MAG: glycosyltransferase 87 family protein [Ktedonobacterales bacterium]
MARQEPVGAIRVPSWAYPLVTVASLLLGAEAVIRGTSLFTGIGDSDLTNFFFKSADYILRGDPWHMYAVRGSGATATYPNYNPPLSIFLIALFRGIGHALHVDSNYGAQITFVALPFMIFVPLLGYLVLRALRSLYPEMPETQQLLAYMLVVLSPLTWQSYGTWYHIEQPMMLCLLVGSMLALRQRREGLAGVLAGAALMTRTTALFPLIGLGVLFLLGREWRGLLKWAGAIALVVAVVMGPFVLGDRANVSYSFLTWRGGAPVGGNSIWTLLAAIGPLSGLVRRLDAPSVVLFVAAAAYLAWRRLRISAYGRDAWAVLAIAALATPMLSKTNWPYYYLEPFILLLVWEFTSMHDRLAGVWRWPLLTFSFLMVAATLSQYLGLRSVGRLDRISLGLLEFAAMLAFAWAIWVRLQAAKPGVAGAAATGYGSASAQAAGQPPIVPGQAYPPPPARGAADWQASISPVLPPTLPASGALGAGGVQSPPWAAAQPSTPLGPGGAVAHSVSPGGRSSWMWTPHDGKEGGKEGSTPSSPWMWTPDNGKGSGGKSQAAPPQQPSSGRLPQGGLPSEWPDLSASWPPRPPMQGGNG